MGKEWKFVYNWQIYNNLIMGVKLRELNSEWNAGEKVYSDDLNDTFDYKINKDEVYTDGVSANQPLSNASIKFGETDTAGKDNKIYASFISSKETIKNILIKKGVVDITPLADIDCGTFVYSENDPNGCYTDDGVVSGARRVTVVNNFNLGWYKLSKPMDNLVIGNTYKVKTHISFSAWFSENYCKISLDSTTLENVVGTTINGYKEYTFIATSTSQIFSIEFGTTAGDYPTPSASIKDFTLTTKQIASNININLYSDNAGTPDNTPIATASIAKDYFNMAPDLTDITVNINANLTPGNTYWLSFEQSSPNDYYYPFISYQNTNQTGFTIKKFNSIDGFNNVTGALYLKVNETGANKIPSLNNSTKLDLSVIPDHSEYWEYVASHNLLVSAPTERTGSGYSTWAKIKEIQVRKRGTYRVIFSSKSNVTSGQGSSTRIYKNGTAYGIQRSTNSNVYATYSEDLVFEANDLIQIYGKSNGGDNHQYIVKDFNIYASPSDSSTTKVNTD